MNTINSTIDKLRLIKKGESGERELKLEDSLHKEIIMQLYDNPKTLVELSEQINISETELAEVLNRLKKVGLLNLVENKYATSFIILDEDQTKYLQLQLQKYARDISASISRFVEQNKEMLLELDDRFKNIEWKQLSKLLVLIFIDFMNEDVWQELNSKYQQNDNYSKPYSIVGYTTENKSCIFRNNSIAYNLEQQHEKIGLFTYGKGEIESVNKERLDSGIAVFDTACYVKLIYSMYNSAEKLRGSIFNEVAKQLENSIPIELRNQTGFVIQNYIGYLRYELLSLITNEKISDNNKISFIILYDNE